MFCLENQMITVKCMRVNVQTNLMS
ncbi:hypothetical protein MAR_007418 [Mya arenaria]|uniref:Uncharacterized protein n=1 Tax=Mya arenaria TaxID=6604 RepID=A0ABY7DBB9_MYAAR|nr:hypothetical protein MAR_007418 [Mya arenaria]